VIRLDTDYIRRPLKVVVLYLKAFGDRYKFLIEHVIPNLYIREALRIVRYRMLVLLGQLLIIRLKENAALGSV
jgi:hypothetical protein